MNLIPQFIRQRISHRPNLVKIIDNIGWLFVDKVLRMGVGLLVGVWVARYLGPEQFGLLSFATAFVGLFSAIASVGLQDVVVRDIVYEPACTEETLGTAASLQFIGGLVAYGLILGTIFWLRPDDGLAKIIVAILGAAMLFKASEVAVFWFESQVQSKYTVLVQNGAFLVFAVIKMALILTHAPLIAFAWVTIAEGLLVAALMVGMLGLRGPRLQQLHPTCARAKALLKDSWPLMLSGVAVMIYMKIDQIMLGQMAGDEAVGTYSAAVRISEVWYFIPTVIVASVFPTILDAKKRSEEHYYQRLQHLFDLVFWLSVGVALPLSFMSTYIVILLFGVAYAESGPVLSIHIWGAVFVFLGVASSKWLLAENRQILSFQRTALGLISNVLLNCLLIPKYGALGAAYATVISFAIAGLFYDLLQKETRKIFLMKVSALNVVRLIGRVRCLRK